jgi:hypothetical protein
MTGGDIEAFIRVNTSEPSTGGRWSSADILTEMNPAIRAVGMRVDWPEATATTSTIAKQQEYALPEIMCILRVYLAGQLLYPTDIPALQGEQIEYFDQSSSTLQPQWQVAAPSAYPLPNDQANPVPGGLPYYAGQRPMFYLRGGCIGFVPAPVAIYTAQMDYVPLPVTIIAGGAAGAGTVSDMPLLFLEAIGWKTMALMHKADGDDSQANDAEGHFEKCLKDCISWKRNLVRNKPRRTYVYPYRILYTGPFGGC